MKLERLSIRGMLAFGETATVDFAALEPGVYAIWGANGAGKTTFLEAPIAALYRTFPSRDGHLIDYATRPDSAIDLVADFAPEGRYHARVSLNATTRGSDAVLEALTPDGAVALNQAGNVSTFDAAVQKDFPDLALIQASAFGAQRRDGSFVHLKPAARKDLFAKLLGLDRYAALAGTATAAGARVQAALLQRRGAKDQLARDVDHAEQRLKDDQEYAVANLEAAQGAETFFRRELDIARQRVADLRATADRTAQEVSQATLGLTDRSRRAGDAALEAQRAAKVLTEALAARDRVVGIHEPIIARAQATLEALPDRAALERQADAKRTDLRARASVQRDRLTVRRQAQQAYLDAGDRIRVAVLDHAAKSEALEAARARLADVEKDLREQDRVLRASREALEPLLGAEANLTHHRRRVEILGTVPCRGEGAYAGCNFLVDARMAQSQIPVLEQNVQALEQARAAVAAGETSQAVLQNRVELVKREIAVLEQEVRALGPAAAEGAALDAATARLTEISTDLEALEKALSDDLAVADQWLSHETARVAFVREEADRDLAAARATLERERAAATQAIDQADAALLDARATEREAAEALAAAQAAVAPVLRVRDEAAAAVPSATAAERDAEGALEQAVAARARAEAEQGRLTAARAALTASKQRLAALTAHEERLAGQLARWEAFARCFGRNGLPVIEIDNAGPAVSARCNDLLAACGEGRFTVELVTQEAKTRGGVKETFELKVYDSARGGEARDLADLSGGEQVLVDEALKSALSLEVNAQGRHPIRTCWRDETTGALHSDTALRYVTMLRRVRELGGFHHVLFITHNADAARAADGVLWVRDGRIDVCPAPIETLEEVQ